MNRIIRNHLRCCTCYHKEGKKNSAPTEVGKIFSNLIRNRMELYSDKSITTEKNLSKKNAPALLSNSKILKAFFN